MLGVLVLSLASTFNWCSLPQCPHPAQAPHYIQFSLFYFWFTSRVRCPSYSWQRQHTSTSPSAPFPLQRPLFSCIAKVTRRSRLVSSLHFPNWVHCPVDPTLRKVRKTPILLGSVPSSTPSLLHLPLHCYLGSAAPSVLLSLLSLLNAPLPGASF